jgi:hypothetical protein
MKFRRPSLQLDTLEARELPSVTAFPNTSNGIYLLSDQLNGGLSDSLVRFISTHYAGTQKLLPAENARYVANNPSWVLLHYRLATTSGPAGYITNGQWGSDWNSVTAHEDWFMHDPNGQRLHNSTWNWDVHDIMNPAWRQYWLNSVIADMRIEGAQGVFADSFDAGVGPGWFTQSDPRFDGTNAANPAAWPNGFTWIDQQADLINYMEAGFAATPEKFVYIPNLDALVTSWDHLDTSKLDGGFLEGFGDWGPSYLNGSPSDWTLSMNRALAMSDAGKILIMQPTLVDTANSPTGLLQRGFDLGTYLLLKGDHTYLNIVSDATNSGAYYYPEDSIDLGPAVTPLATDVSQYMWNNVYRRDFQNGIVLVNPTNSTFTVTLGQNYRLVQFSGGGGLDDTSLDANGNYIGGSLSYTDVNTVTLAPGSSFILLNESGLPTGKPPAAPTGLTATAGSSGQIDLQWVGNTDATGYRVERSTDGTNFSTVATLGSTATTFSDTGLTAGTQYDYRVVAANTAGDSAPSNVASAVAADVAVRFVVSSPTRVTAGTSFNLTVTAVDAAGNVVQGYTGTVHFQSSSAKGALPADYNFVAGDQGVHTFTVTLKTAGTQSVTVSDSANSQLTGNVSGIRVGAAAARALVISAPTSIRAGVAFSVTIKVIDAYGNIATGYTGTVHFTDSVGSATLPANYKFTSGAKLDNGVHTFTGLILRKKVAQTLKVVDTLHASIAGSVTETPI